MEKNSPLKLPLLAAAAPGAIKGLAGIAGGIIGSRKRKREERAAQREYDKYKTQLEVKKEKKSMLKKFKKLFD